MLNIIFLRSISEDRKEAESMQTGAAINKAAKIKRARQTRTNQDNMTPTRPSKFSVDMVFGELVKRCIERSKEMHSSKHSSTYSYLGKRWVREWGKLMCDELTPQTIRDYLEKRKQVSATAANKDLRYLKALFSFGLYKRHILNDPTEGIEFFPATRKKRKRERSGKDYDKLIACADPDTADYLTVLKETGAGLQEVNLLAWQDVDFEGRRLIVYNKKRAGVIAPRRIGMTDRLWEILKRRYEGRDVSNPWVFSHKIWSRKEKRFEVRPYGDRSRRIKTLCRKAGVPYLRN